MFSCRKICLLISSLVISALAINQDFAFGQNTDANSNQWQKFSSNRYRLSLNGMWHATDNRDSKGKSIKIPGILAKSSETRLTRRFFLPDSLRNKAIILHVSGVNYLCRISVNDSPVASHAGGYTAFDFELKPGVLKYGEENTLTVEINDKLSTKTTLPFKHRPFGWQHRGGILHEIFLEAQPSVSIGGLRIDQKFTNSYFDATLEIDIHLNAFNEIDDTLSQTKNFTIYSEVFDENDSKAVAVSPKQTLEIDNQIEKNDRLEIELKDVKKWQPQQPQLYSLVTYLLTDNRLVDSVTVPIGIREVKIEKNRFVLNGEPFVVKGVTLQDNFYGLSEEALDSTLQIIMESLKTLGANTLRVIGHPPHPQLVEHCSREGIFLLEEIPLYYANAAQLQSEEVADLALQQLAEMVNRDILQPSVLAWGLGVNLDESQGAKKELLERLAETANKQDNRPIYYVKRHRSKNPVNSALDFALIDYFCKTEFSVASSHSFSKPILPILGYWVENSNSNDPSQEQEWIRNEAEEIHAEKLQKIFDLYRSDWPDSAGFFIHTLYDWLGAQPLLSTGNARNLFVYPAGLIDINGHQRIGYRLSASYYLNERRPPISPNKMTSENPIVFPLTGIIAILVFLFFLNRDKKLRVQFRRAFVHPHGFYSDMFENRKTPAFLTFLLGMIQGLIFGLIVTSVFFTYKENLLFDEILNLLVPSAKAKGILIWLVWHPGWMIALIAVSYFILMLFLALFLKIISIVSRSSLSYFQYFTLVFWTAINYLPLIFIAPILYRLLPEKEIALYCFIGVGFFIFWHFVRLQRGLRVFYLISPAKSMLLCLIIVSLIIGPILLHYHRAQAIFDYWGYYAALVW